jgi:hypothetical protein
VKLTPQGNYPLRYEDVAQDGRVLLLPLTASLGTVWNRTLMKHPLLPWCREQMVLPILTRLKVSALGEPFAVETGLDVEGAYELAKTLDAQGNTHRLLLNLYTELYAPKGRTNLPPPDDAGVRANAGSVLAEHVFTRPFGPKEERRVSSLPDFGGPPLGVYPWSEPKELLLPPPGAKALDELSLDDTSIPYGMVHTDSNQHVNSLVYPRLFEDAALRRFAKLERDTQVLSRFLDVRFRKPSFAGDQLQLYLQAFELDGKPGALGAFVEPGTQPAQARAIIQLRFA